MANSLNTITVDGVTYDYDEYKASLHTNSQSTTPDYLGKDVFLQLLVTQMQYQDPLDPMDNGEYLSQLAQFSALEQMTNVAEQMGDVYTLIGNMDTSILVGQLTNMIDQKIQWATTDSNGITTMHEGIAKSVSISDGVPSLMVETEMKDTDGNTVKAVTKVDISDITRIGEGDLS